MVDLTADFLGWQDDFNLHRAAPGPPSALPGLPRGTDCEAAKPPPCCYVLLLSPFLLSWPHLCAGAVRWPGSAHGHGAAVRLLHKHTDDCVHQCDVCSSVCLCIRVIIHFPSPIAFTKSLLHKIIDPFQVSFMAGRNLRGDDRTRPACPSSWEEPGLAPPRERCRPRSVQSWSSRGVG